MRRLSYLLFIFFFILAIPVMTFAQDNFRQEIFVVKAKVKAILSETQETVENITGISRQVAVQKIEAEILEGQNVGKIVVFDNDYLTLRKGSLFYFNEIMYPDGTFEYSFNAPYRINAFLLLLAIFLALVYLFGGMQGVRGIASLVGSLLLIVFALIPSILHGFSPFLASFGIAAVIIIIGSYITHGFNKTTTSAVAGMIVTIIFTGLLTFYAIHASYLTGLEENIIHLSLYSDIEINFIGLLFGGIMIGLLGVLYDIAISQAIAVEELHKIAPHLNRQVIYKRAIRIGKEHIGALVNTLAIAYVGVSLPLLLLYTKSDIPFFAAINQEIFATEIVRILTSSIGLVLAVPITTILATYIIIKSKNFKKEDIKKDEAKLESFGHIHHG